MSTAERWLPVPSFPGYEVSDLGRVWSHKLCGRYLKTYLNGSGGYQAVDLTRDKRVTACLVHRVVLEAFVGPCPPGMEGCHGPSGKLDNRLSNLRWDTRSENLKDFVRHGGVPWRTRLITECPRGHRLSDSNVWESDKKQNRRGCRSCGSTHRVRDHLTWDEFLEKADTRYRKITGLEPNSSAPGRLLKEAV